MVCIHLELYILSSCDFCFCTNRVKYFVRFLGLDVISWCQLLTETFLNCLAMLKCWLMIGNLCWLYLSKIVNITKLNSAFISYVLQQSSNASHLHTCRNFVSCFDAEFSLPFYFPSNKDASISVALWYIQLWILIWRSCLEWPVGYFVLYMRSCFVSHNYVQGVSSELCTMIMTRPQLTLNWRAHIQKMSNTIFKCCYI